MDGAREKEGVIKFELHHVPGAAPEHPSLKILLDARDQLYQSGLIGIQDGIGYGNISMRSGNGFIISGSGTGGMARLDSNGYCHVGLYDISRNVVQSFGPVRASSESLTHAAAYEAGIHVQCVIHVHDSHLFHWLALHGYPATPDGAAYGTPEMALAVKELVADDCGIIVMTGHENGVLAYGGSCERTFATLLETMELSRESCQ